MWDFSWLVRRAGPEAEYSDWGQVLDELVDRGYNCIRIDPFPHLLGTLNPSEKGPSEKQAEFTILAPSSSFAASILA